MNMIETMPTTGQFVVVHEFAGNIWGSTYKFEDTELSYFEEGTDEWTVVEDFELHTSAIKILGYIVLEAAE